MCGRAGLSLSTPLPVGKLCGLGSQPAGLPLLIHGETHAKTHFAGRWSENLSPYKISTATNVSALPRKLKITH